MRYCDLCQYEIKAISCLFAPANRINLPSPIHIIAIVSRVLNVSEGDLTGQSRKREFAESRAIAMSLIRSYFPKISLSATGKLFGGRDHSTVIYNVNLAADLISTDRKFKLKYLEIKQQIDKIMRGQPA